MSKVTGIKLDIEKPVENVKMIVCTSSDNQNLQAEIKKCRIRGTRCVIAAIYFADKMRVKHERHCE